MSPGGAFNIKKKIALVGTQSFILFILKIELHVQYAWLNNMARQCIFLHCIEYYQSLESAKMFKNLNLNCWSSTNISRAVSLKVGSYFILICVAVRHLTASSHQYSTVQHCRRTKVSSKYDALQWVAAKSMSLSYQQSNPSQVWTDLNYLYCWVTNI